MRVFDLEDEIIVRFKRKNITYESYKDFQSLKSNPDWKNKVNITFDLVNVQDIDGAGLSMICDMVVKQDGWKSIDFTNVSDSVKAKLSSLEANGLCLIQNDIIEKTRQTAEAILKKMVLSSAQKVSEDRDKNSEDTEEKDRKKKVRKTLTRLGYV